MEKFIYIKLLYKWLSMVCVLPLAKDSVYIHRQMGNLDRQCGDKVENSGAYLKGGRRENSHWTPGIFLKPDLSVLNTDINGKHQIITCLSRTELTCVDTLQQSQQLTILKGSQNRKGGVGGINHWWLSYHSLPSVSYTERRWGSYPAASLHITRERKECSLLWGSHSPLGRNWRHLSNKTTLNIWKHTLSDACFDTVFPGRVSNVRITL